MKPPPPLTPQLTLRLDAAAPDPTAEWRDGAAVRWLGRHLTLVLDTASPAVLRRDAELHVPLPPAATSQQIRDAVESWLRDEALRVFAEKSALAGRLAGLPPNPGQHAIAIKLVFGKRSDWARVADDQLRCHWRLIEQPEAVIEQVIGSALARLAAAPASADLFTPA